MVGQMMRSYPILQQRARKVNYTDFRYGSAYMFKFHAFSLRATFAIFE